VDEFGAELDIHLDGAVHELEILGRDLGDGDVVDVDLLFADEVLSNRSRGPS